MAKILTFLVAAIFLTPALFAQADAEAARKQELDRLKKQAAQ